MGDKIRIPVDLTGKEKYINIKIEQEFDALEILSLQMTSSELYTRETSDFGVIVGRVLLSNGMSVQNAKVNIFIPIIETDKERPEIVSLYPFETVNDTYPNGVRYNLLPRTRNNKNTSHRAVGNFPCESDFTHYPQYLEVMDKYYKYTTITNESGDYMIFGVPIGQHDIIMDFDIFDTDSFNISANDLIEQISLNKSIEELRALINLSASETTVDPYRVPNFIYKGNNNYEVEPKIALDEMPNIFHQIKQITVSSFWGDESLYDVGITRCDFKINFKYTPTAIFFGYIHSPSGGYYIKPDYTFNLLEPEIHGIDDSLGYPTGDIYPYQKKEIVIYRLDDDLNIGSRKRLGVFSGTYYNGAFRITLPMYMDYYTTNEFGDLIPTTDTVNGVPTKGHYCFEIYDTDEAWNGRRTVWGDFNNSILPGVRIPSSSNGANSLGGWEGTWGGIFEYDIINRKRKFYTVKTTYVKHSPTNILLPGDTISYFPKLNLNKTNVAWNFPINTNTNLSLYDEPTIIGSILLPRVQIVGTDVNVGKIDRPYKIINELWIDESDTYHEWIYECEVYLGLGVQRKNGKNYGDVFSSLFSADQYINDNVNIFGDLDTWNYGDNTSDVFTPTLFAIEKAKSSESKANTFSVHPAYNQTINPEYTYGAFINCTIDNNKNPLMDISIHDITDDLPNLIKDKVYSSYNKGVLDLTSSGQTQEFTEIYVESDGVIQSGNTTILNTDTNAYKGNFYYFGTWSADNSLYDIETNYFIK